MALVFFAYTLFYTYKLKVSPLFAYSGLTFRSPDPFSYSIAIALTVIVAVALPRTITRVSDFILWVFFVLGVAPSILLAQYSKTLESAEALKMGFTIAATTLIVIFLAKLGPQEVNLVKRFEKGTTFWTCLVVFSIAVYTALVFQTGLSFKYLALDDVYGVRSDFGTASAGSIIVGYLLPVQINAVNPMFIIKGILSKRVVPLSVGCLGQFVAYATGGQKSTLFSLFAILGIVLLFRIYNLRVVRGSAILLGITAISTLALLADRLNGGILWTSLISRRVMIVPGALTAAYVEVFHNSPRQNFAEVIPLFPNPYTDIRPVNIVGAQFVGDPTTAANVNLFGHGYLQMGYLGMFIEGAVLAILLILANSATRDLPLVVSCVAFFGGTLALVSASVFTTTLTNGFFATIVLCALAPPDTWHRSKTSKSSPQAGDQNASSFIARQEFAV